MPGPRSLFWRLVLLVAGFCLSLIWATNYLSTRIDQYVSHLPEASLRELRGYASEAAAAAAAGPDALRGWQTNNAVLSPELLVVLDADREPLPGQQLSDTQRDRLSFVRGYDRPMSMRGDGRRATGDR